MEPNTPPAKSSRHFFKIILQTTVDEKKLMLPLKFAKKHGDELFDVAKIIAPDGHVWQVRLTKSGSNIWFDDGWPKFVNDYSICRGSFLLFKYEGMSNFSVIIFDMSACEIQYQCNEPNHEDEDPHNGRQCSVRDRNQMEDDFIKKLSSTSSPKMETEASSKRITALAQKNLLMSIPGSGNMRINKRHISDPLARNPKFKHNCQRKGKMKNNEASSNDEDELSLKCEQQSEVITGRNFYDVLAKMSAGSEKAVQAAILHEPKNPSYMFILQKCHIRSRSLYMPPSFSKYLDAASKYIEIVVADGREWLIQTAWREYGRVDLTTGWTEFAMDNSLKEGDVGVFELIMLKSTALKASIFRATSCGSVVKPKMHKKSTESAETSHFGNIYNRRRKSCKSADKIAPTIIMNEALESEERKSNGNGDSRNNKADGSEFSVKDEEMHIDCSQRFHLSIKNPRKVRKHCTLPGCSSPRILPSW